MCRPRLNRVALWPPSKAIVLDLMHAPRFAGQAPAEIYACLSTKASTSARSAPCTGSWPPAKKSESAASGCGIQSSL
jgi:hypothetical protein